MKKIFRNFAVIACSLSLFTACSSDDDENGGGSSNPSVGTYKLTDYTAEDYNWSGDTPTPNWPVSGALYTKWSYTGDDNYPEFMSALFRFVGGDILPQVLNSVKLDAKGNILADYVAQPTIVFDQSSIMGIFFGSGFPTATEVTGHAATDGFTTSPKGVASWSESNGKFTVKLSLSAILEAVGGSDLSGMTSIIEGVLNSEPAALKEMLGGLLDADLSGLQDATITQLVGWVKNGIPMNIERNETGRTLIYLDKTAFDNLFTKHGEGDEAHCDLMIIWNALVASGKIPTEAQPAGLLVTLIEQYWPVTTEFRLGLDLMKQ